MQQGSNSHFHQGDQEGSIIAANLARTVCYAAMPVEKSIRVFTSRAANQGIIYYSVMNENQRFPLQWPVTNMIV